MSDLSRYYETLGLKPGASAAEIKAAYRDLAKQWHPDRFMSNRQEASIAEEKLKAINEAYRLLREAKAWEQPHMSPQSPVSPSQPQTRSQSSSRPMVRTRAANAQVYYDMATEAVGARNYPEALEYLRAAIRMDGQYAEAYKFRGFVNSLLGYELSAQADLQKAEQLEFERSLSNTAPTPKPSPAAPAPDLQPWTSTILCDRPTEPITAVAVASDGRLLASATQQGAIDLWNLKTRTGFCRLHGHEGAIYALAMSADGQLLVSAGADRAIRFWHIKTGTMLRSLSGHTAAVRSLALSPDRRVLISGSDDGSIKHWPLSAQSSRPSVFTNRAHAAPVRAVALSHVMVMSIDEARMLLTQLRTGETLHTYPAMGELVAIAPSPNGTAFATGSRNGQVTLWSVGSPEPVRSLQDPSQPMRSIGAIAYSPNGQLLATGGTDTALRLWNPETGQLRGRLNGHAKEIRAIAFVTHQSLITGSLDGSIRLWHRQ
ncbi:DnaJ domain-containing protein [Leptolyngbya sp. AN02str]|uniref:DnaJ domain-containing protein n=1 Tax=Leptolyngbya sp. AN02str TaxID=3423363 RepID=UPI003D31CC5D